MITNPFFKTLSVLSILSFHGYAQNVSIKFPFRGAYAGGILGGGFWGSEHSFESATLSKTKSNLKSFGINYGLLAGYMHLTDGKVFYAGEITFEKPSGKVSTSLASNGVNYGKFEAKIKSKFLLSAMIGAPINPRLVASAKMSYGRSSFSITYNELTSIPTAFKKDMSVSSIEPSAGIMHSFTDNIMVGLEGGTIVSAKKLTTNYNGMTMHYTPGHLKMNATLRWIFF